MANQIPEQKFWDFYYCIDIIEAERLLDLIPISSFADYKNNDDRNRILRNLKSRSQSNRETQIKTLTPEELAYGEAKESFLNGR